MRILCHAKQKISGPGLTAIVSLLLLILAAPYASLPAGYQGTPFADSLHRVGPPTIPGQVDMGLYDLGGEGIAYHDDDALNHGGGSDNYKQQCTDSTCAPLPPYYCFFRGKEGVDITAPKCVFDFSRRHGIIPPTYSAFLEFTYKGEWTNYTVNVLTPGKYRIGALYALVSKDSASISLNGIANAAKIVYPGGTGGPHFWMYTDSVATINFPDKGLNLLTVYVAGGENLNYLKFVRVGEPATSVPRQQTLGPLVRGRNAFSALPCPGMLWGWQSGGQAKLSAFDASGKEYTIHRD